MNFEVESADAGVGQQDVAIGMSTNDQDFFVFLIGIFRCLDGWSEIELGKRRW